LVCCVTSCRLIPRWLMGRHQLFMRNLQTDTWYFWSLCFHPLPVDSMAAVESEEVVHGREPKDTMTAYAIIEAIMNLSESTFVMFAPLAKGLSSLLHRQGDTTQSVAVSRMRGMSHSIEHWRRRLGAIQRHRPTSLSTFPSPKSYKTSLSSPTLVSLPNVRAVHGGHTLQVAPQ